MAPVFNLMEREVMQKMCELVGWSHGDGLFAPGGSVSNLYGVVAARHNKFPETKEKGTLHLPQLTIFISDEASPHGKQRVSLYRLLHSLLGTLFTEEGSHSAWNRNRQCCENQV